jgi:hypothetical protein
LFITLSSEPRYSYNGEMDEILIEEKKYISSKRAAKITGYAKDYIGQLCREGRVPARLVGRSWYVLEAAIQDHRFGASEPQNKEKYDLEGPDSSAYESPRYEADPISPLPAINRIKKAPVEDVEVKLAEEHESLQNVWGDWFSPTEAATDSTTEVFEEDHKIQEELATQLGQESLTKTWLEVNSEEEVYVPIRPTRYAPLPKELLPRHSNENSSNSLGEERERGEVAIANKRGNTEKIQVSRILLALTILVAVVAGSLAILSTGYFDGSIESFGNSVSFLSGIFVLNK